MSIIIDIALLNPRTYSISMAVVSILFGLLEQEQTECIVNKIINKFNAIPNTGHMQIWLQRATIKLRISKSIFDESLCKLINNESTTLWNNSWLHRTNQNLLNNRGNIIQQDILDGIDIEIQNNEVLLFGEHSL